MQMTSGIVLAGALDDGACNGKAPEATTQISGNDIEKCTRSAVSKLAFRHVADYTISRGYDWFVVVVELYSTESDIVTLNPPVSTDLLCRMRQ